MTIVYGNTIEPGGMQLNDDEYEDVCTECGATCSHRHYETCDGSINQRFSINCDHCGFHNCNAEVCSSCDDVPYRSEQDDADYYSEYMLNVTTPIGACAFIANVEGELLVIKAKVALGISHHTDFFKVKDLVEDCERLSLTSIRKTAFYLRVVQSVESLSSDLAFALPSAYA
ncbi:MULTISPECIES: hypothetical protein [Morganellaceae]|uniref:Uncharacterized protein n=2 Tax=Gammaproteobacteria TaxID=1236 RepID=A0A9Q8Q5P4_9GAMM|nr:MULTISPECIES: hypothetical protein [Morganellaceae]UNH32407.1 hypothetical protein MNY72_16890 [Moellerella wisconsensis]WJW83635.1 hypothetical protein QU516_15570 [Moellerella wisconsensis]